jgi:L-methionine (R)-S-oxide reductase
MALDRDKLLAELDKAISNRGDRRLALEKVAMVLRTSGGYRWVGLYDVDTIAGMVVICAWSGPGAPQYPQFPATRGLTGAAIAARKTVNVGEVTADPRYLTAFGTTRSEIIIPVLDIPREKVIGTIDVESEHPNAFSENVQALLEACAELIRPLWQR